MKGATLALTALVAASAAFAQATPPSTTAEPPTSTTPQEQSQDPASSQSDPSASQGGRADTQALMNDCLQQVQQANPNVSESDVRKFCENEINKASQSPQR